MKRLTRKENNSQLWMCPVMKGKADAVKKKYCIGTWNVRSMNQGKFHVVKCEMARVDISILGISELKLMVTGEYKSDVALMVNKRG